MANDGWDGWIDRCADEKKRGNVYSRLTDLTTAAAAATLIGSEPKEKEKGREGKGDGVAVANTESMPRRSNSTQPPQKILSFAPTVAIAPRAAALGPVEERKTDDSIAAARCANPISAECCPRPQSCLPPHPSHPMHAAHLPPAQLLATDAAPPRATKGPSSRRTRDVAKEPPAKRTRLLPRSNSRAPMHPTPCCANDDLCLLCVPCLPCLPRFLGRRKRVPPLHTADPPSLQKNTLLRRQMAARAPSTQTQPKQCNTTTLVSNRSWCLAPKWVQCNDGGGVGGETTGGVQ